MSEGQDRRGPHKIRVGWVELPSGVLSPREKGPLDSHASLVKYIERNGSFRELTGSYEECFEFWGRQEIPPKHLWAAQITKLKYMGLPPREVEFKSGITAQS